MNQNITMSQAATGERVRCNVCGAPCVVDVLALGGVPPLQNRCFVKQADATGFAVTDVRYAWCDDCHHISVIKSLSVAFDESYDNDQHYSTVFKQQLDVIARDVRNAYPELDGPIVEIGCGNGQLLEMLKNEGYLNLQGYDPAAKSTKNTMVSTALWEGGEPGSVGLFILRHTLEEVSEINLFMDKVSEALYIGGLVYCEVTNVDRLLTEDGIFSLYPEYENFFSVLSIARVFSKKNIMIERVVPINGGAWLGVWARKASVFHCDDGDGLLAAIRRSVCALDRPLVVWGGAGRGMNILSFLKLTTDIVGHVVDINKNKQGMFVPPYGQAIVSPEMLTSLNVKSVLVSNSKYRSEIEALVPMGCHVYTLSDLKSNE